ncbi:hypothetical protein RhiirA1_528982 [Rhizophagus irregularis]|uniref:Uncharacterized protein n=1 Tax=Rhizophagus irregularis TaxID=588596 RepID=A0A2N0SHY0_9GLOM|nr:hypothetical protein RhiirA1_528982 [Rhizophagus irregularis]
MRYVVTITELALQDQKPDNLSDVINAKEVEAKELVVELTPSLENIAYFTADDADDADGIFNADNTNDDNCDDADDKKNSDEDEEILYDFFDLFLEGVELANEDFETYKSLVWNKKFTKLGRPIKTRNSKAIACLKSGDSKMIKCLDFTGLHFEALNYKTMMGTARRFGASKDYRCLNVIDNISFGNYYELRSAANVTLSDLGTRLQLGIGFGLFREGSSRGGSGNGSNGDSSGCEGGSNGGVPDNKSGIYESSSENRGDSKAPSNSNEHSFGGGYNEGSTDRLEA